MRVIPPSVAVIVPVRGAALVFAVAFILNEPLPVRLVGVMLLIVSHEALLVGMFHVPLAVTFTVANAAADGGVHVFMLSANVVTPACVTVIVRETAPFADIVTVPVLAVLELFTEVTSVSAPVPVRLAGVSVSHD